MGKNRISSKSCYSRWVKAAATLSDGRETILYYADPPDDEGSYYGVTFNQSDTSFIAFRDAVGNGGNNTLISNVSKEVFSKTKVKEAYNESHKDAQVEYFNDLLTKGIGGVKMSFGTPSAKKQKNSVGKQNKTTVYRSYAVVFAFGKIKGGNCNRYRNFRNN